MVYVRYRYSYWRRRGGCDRASRCPVPNQSARELPGGFPDPETIALTDYNFTIHDVYDFDPKTKYKSVTNKVVAVMALAQKRGVIRSYPVVISV